MSSVTLVSPNQTVNRRHRQPVTETEGWDESERELKREGVRRERKRGRNSEEREGERCADMHLGVIAGRCSSLWLYGDSPGEGAFNSPL